MLWHIALQALLRATLCCTRGCSTNKITELVPVNFFNLSIVCDWLLPPAAEPTTEPIAESVVTVSITETVIVRLMVTSPPSLHQLSGHTSTISPGLSVSLPSLPALSTGPATNSCKAQVIERTEEGSPGSNSPLAPRSASTPTALAIEPTALVKNFFGRSLEVAAARPKPAPRRRFSHIVVDKYHSEWTVTFSPSIRGIMRLLVTLFGEESGPFGRVTPSLMKTILKQLAADVEGGFQFRPDGAVTSVVKPYVSFMTYSWSFWRNTDAFIESVPATFFNQFITLVKMTWSMALAVDMHFGDTYMLGYLEPCARILIDPMADHYGFCEQLFPSLTRLMSAARAIIDTWGEVRGLCTRFVMDELARNRSGLVTKVMWFILREVFFKQIVHLALCYFFCRYLSRISYNSSSASATRGKDTDQATTSSLRPMRRNRAGNFWLTWLAALAALAVIVVLIIGIVIFSLLAAVAPLVTVRVRRRLANAREWLIKQTTFVVVKQEEFVSEVPRQSLPAPALVVYPRAPLHFPVRHYGLINPYKPPVPDYVPKVRFEDAWKGKVFS